MTQSPLSVIKFSRAFIAWWLIWAGLQAVFLVWLGIDWRIAVTDSFLSNSLIAAACLLLCYVMQFYLPQQERYWYLLFVSIVLSTFVAFNVKFCLGLIYSDQPLYLSMLKNSFPIRWGVSFLLIMCMSVLSLLWYTFRDQQETENRKKDAEALSRDAELFALRRQLQPHFLFNSLNSISALAGTRPQEAREMIQQLADFLRGTLKDSSQVVTLKEELIQLNLYMSIEQVRFGHRLKTTIETTDECCERSLPSLFLQPIVENAIKFGLYDMIDEVLIKIEAKCEDNRLIISVENPFDPLTAKHKTGTGFGLTSIQRRLYLLYGRSDLLFTESANNIFKTTIIIPQLNIYTA